MHYMKVYENFDPLDRVDRAELLMMMYYSPMVGEWYLRVFHGNNQGTSFYIPHLEEKEEKALNTYKRLLRLILQLHDGSEEMSKNIQDVIGRTALKYRSVR